MEAEVHDLVTIPLASSGGCMRGARLLRLRVLAAVFRVVAALSDVRYAQPRAAESIADMKRVRKASRLVAASIGAINKLTVDPGERGELDLPYQEKQRLEIANEILRWVGGVLAEVIGPK